MSMNIYKAKNYIKRQWIDTDIIILIITGDN